MRSYLLLTFYSLLSSTTYLNLSWVEVPASLSPWNWYSQMIPLIVIEARGSGSILSLIRFVFGLHAAADHDQNNDYNADANGDLESLVGDRATATTVVTVEVACGKGEIHGSCDLLEVAW